jgi:predicted transcriptional regulator
MAGKKPKANLDKMTAIRVEGDEYKRLQQIGQELDRPVSWVIRKAVQEFIERYKPAKQ